MLEFLEHVFGGDVDGLHNGLVEIAYSDDQNAIRYARLFGTDELDDAAKFAAHVNARPGCNAYVGMALRHPDAPRDKRTSKQWFLGTVVLWNDWDGDGELDDAKRLYQFCPPTAGVITGRIPTKRGQAFWRLTEAIRDHNEVEHCLAGIQKALGGDPKVLHAECVMRLPGSVSWPKPNKPERVAELTTLHMKPVAPYAPDRIRLAYKPKDPQALRQQKQEQAPEQDVTTTPGGALGLEERISDGREQYMRDTVLACLVQFVGETGCEPDAQDLFDLAWPQYKRKADLTRAGRGADELMRKCVYTAVRFRNGRIDGLETLAKAAEAYAKRPAEVSAAATGTADDDQDDDADVFSVMDFAAMAAMPPVAWLVKGLLTDDGFAIAYGPPGSFKSFIALDIALSVAYGKPWRDEHDVTQGAVLYIASEGVRGLWKRIQAWREHYGAGHDAPFMLLPTTVNMLDEADVRKLIRTVQALEARVGKFRMVVIDTVARAFVGGDENTAQDMNRFVAGADMVRQTLGAATIGVHHSGKDSDRGARGSSALKGAVDTMLKVERTEMIVAVETEKQKDEEPLPTLYFKGEPVELPGRPLGEPERSLVFTPYEPVTKQGGGEEVSWQTIDAMFDAIAEAWSRGHPFSLATQTRKTGRYWPMWASRRFGIKATAAEKMAEDWLCSGNLVVEVFNQKDKSKGIKVARRLRPRSAEVAEDGG